MKDSTNIIHNKRKRAVVAGHICLDVMPDMSHLPSGEFVEHFKPGHLISVGAARFAAGGPVSNVGLALHKLGIPTHLIAKTGDDPYGRILQQIITDYDEHLLRGLRIDIEQPTSYSVIISPPGVDRIFLHCPGVNDAFKASDIDFELVAEADLMHFGYPPIMQQMYQNGGAELVDVFRRAKGTGITTSLDMAFPDPASPGGQVDWRDILGVVLPFVDIFAPSIEEIIFMLHRPLYETMCADFGDVLTSITPSLISDLGTELLELGATIILLKLGHQGAYLRTAEQTHWADFGRATPVKLADWGGKELWSSCYQVDVVGTTGSGDATIAGFLSALLRNLSPHAALNIAVAVGACNVEAPDALGGLYAWEETLNRIQNGWDKHSLKLHIPGWTWDNHYRIWNK
jgi:sugar/nucleoside kinase (ribokinase family)